jgi:F-type H+-transporting ATPase subunit gamma
MASAREIKRRMKSVKNIMQVTRALEAVSASKVRRAAAPNAQNDHDTLDNRRSWVGGRV